MDYWQVLRNRYGVILLAFFLVFMTAAVVVYILPKQFLGKVVMQINREFHEWKVFHSPMPSGRHYLPPNFVQTEIDHITSKETLYLVVDKVKLDERWDMTRPMAYEKLESQVRTKENRGTDNVTIKVYDRDAELAVRIANEVASAYSERRITIEKKRSFNALQTLGAELRTSRDEVEDARLRMLQIAEREKIVDFAALTNRSNPGGTPVTGSSDILMSAKLDAYKANNSIATITRTIESLKGLPHEQLIQNAAMLGIADPTLQNLWPTFLKFQSERLRLLDSGCGEKHPRVIEADNQLALIDKQMNEAVETVKKTLQVNLENAKATAEGYKKTLEELTSDSMDERSNVAEYTEAKDDYERKKLVLANMEAKYATEKVDLSMPKKPITINEHAERADRFAKPNVPLSLIFGAIMGLAFGIGLAFFLEYLDTSVKTLEDVERYLEVPVLAVIPKDVGVLHKQSGLTPDAEAYRILRTNIEFNRKSADANAITVVSGGAGEGKSTTLVNLAYICAQGGYNTLMIDGDLRRPKLHTFFDINNSVGLTNYLTTELMLEDVVLQTPVDNLYFMPSGILPADAAGILNSRRMSELIADVKNRFDLVLIDSPPILGVSDAAVLASEVDLTMVVIQHRKLPRSMLLRVKQCVENVGGNLLGVVLNNVDVRSDSQYQYYTSYYTYYSPTNTQTRSTRRKEKPVIEPTEAAETPAPASPSRDDEY